MPRAREIASKLWPFLATAAVFAVIFLRIPFRRLVEAMAQAHLAPFLALMAAFSENAQTVAA